MMGDPAVIVTALLAALAVVVQLRSLHRERDTSDFDRQLHERDVQIAELKGQIQAMQATMDAFARALIIEARSNPA